jgi:hypothetical protein
MLSAKLFEDRIVLIDNASLEFHKTKFLEQLLKPYMSDRIAFLTPFEADRNFELACRNLNNIRLVNP